MLILSYLYSKLSYLASVVPFRLLWLMGRALELTTFSSRQRHAVDNFRTQIWKDFLQRNLSQSTSKVIFAGRKITFANSGSQDFWRFKTLELKERDTVWWIKECSIKYPKATFFDVGSNVGIYSLAWLTASEGRACCFEPLPSNVNTLLRNLELNKFEERAIVFQVAISKGQGFMELQTPSLGSGEGFARISDDELKRPEAHFSWMVPTYRLDSMDLQGEQLIVKIDVEGHELEVVEGMSGLLESGRIVAILLEKNPRQDKVLALLQNFGFAQVEQAPTGGNIVLARPGSPGDGR